MVTYSHSTEGERVSPPPSSIGVGVIGLALNRYSRSSSLSQTSDSQNMVRVRGVSEGRVRGGGPPPNNGRFGVSIN